MRCHTLAFLVVAAAAGEFGAAATAHAETTPRLSGPFTHANLSIYFIHGSSSADPVPVTLGRALENNQVRVHETGSVNNLEIENIGASEIFIQAGDIVKGGQQDRVLTVSMVLPPNSGKVGIGSFCVEQGRWARRGMEDVKHFTSAAEALPSRAAKLAMAAPNRAASEPADNPAARTINGAARQAIGRSSGDDTSRRQREMWAAVTETQSKLAMNLGVAVSSAKSETSLQLSLENEKVRTTRDAYVAAIADKANADDIVGFVVAINGRISSADQYASNGLFKSMWSKQLASSATEAIGEERKAGAQGAKLSPPEIAAVQSFLDATNQTKASEKPIGTLAVLDVRDADTVLRVDARRTGGAFVHRSYLAK